MNWPVAFKWARNIFAVLGVLGTMLVAVVVTWASYQEAQYQQRAEEAEKPPPVSLESAAGLMSSAGLGKDGANKLLGGINEPWDDGERAEAYCLQADIQPSGKGWSNVAALDPYLARSAGLVLDFAHGRLDCIPPSTALRNPDLRVKLIALELDGDGIVQSRIALRDSASDRYYLVNAYRPAMSKGATSTPSPSTE